jgi:hypothetical protein
MISKGHSAFVASRTSLDAPQNVRDDRIMTNDDEADQPVDAARLRELLAAIEAHPGKKARRAWDALGLVHMAFMSNQAEFLRLVEAIESNGDDYGVAMASTVPRYADRSEALYAELFRRLHNYVSSAVTLIDHTRNLTRGYEGTPTHTEYMERIASIRAAGLGPFVAKLRVFVVHVGVPAFGTRVAFEAGLGETITSFIDRDAALTWSDWPADARTYLESQPPQVSLRELITAYGAVVEDLYRWFYEQFTVLHGADIDAVNALIMQTPWGGRMPAPPQK